MTDTPTRRVATVEPMEPDPYGPGGSEAVAPVLDNREKIAVVKSPTGTPKVQPSAVKWWLAGAVGVVAGLELCAQQAPDPTVQLICRIGAVAVGSFVGAASPGFRKR